MTGVLFSYQANPPSFDRSEDLASLLYLNESSVMHTLLQRYGGNLIHTHSGPNMVVINPISSPSMYSEKVSTSWTAKHTFFPMKKHGETSLVA